MKYFIISLMVFLGNAIGGVILNNLNIISSTTSLLMLLGSAIPLTGIGIYSYIKESKEKYKLQRNKLHIELKIKEIELKKQAFLK